MRAELPDLPVRGLDRDPAHVSADRRECAPDSSQGQVTQRETAASSQRSGPQKPDPLGRFGQRQQGNAAEGRRRAQTPRVKLEVVLEHAGSPCCPSRG